MRETDYIGRCLDELLDFANDLNVHVQVIAHPAKMQREKNGDIPVPTLYDISGSANWVNKADLGVVVHRNPTNYPSTTEIHVRKVRFKFVGKIGMVELRYDPATGRYSEAA